MNYNALSTLLLHLATIARKCQEFDKISLINKKFHGTKHSMILDSSSSTRCRYGLLEQYEL